VFFFFDFSPFPFLCPKLSSASFFREKTFILWIFFLRSYPLKEFAWLQQLKPNDRSMERPRSPFFYSFFVPSGPRAKRPKVDSSSVCRWRTAVQFPCGSSPVSPNPIPSPLFQRYGPPPVSNQWRGTGASLLTTKCSTPFKIPGIVPVLCFSFSTRFIFLGSWVFCVWVFVFVPWADDFQSGEFFLIKRPFGRTWLSPGSWPWLPQFLTPFPLFPCCVSVKGKWGASPRRTFFPRFQMLSL